MPSRLLMLLFCLSLASISQATLWQVNVADFAFTPGNLTILQGDTVRWTNTAGFHNVHHRCNPALFGNDPADAPWTYQFVFNVSPGNYPYECEIHPDMMQGNVTVTRRGHWNVTVRSFSFTPQHLTILPGDTVIWTNVSGFHNVHHTGTPSLFGLAAASAPWTYSFVFNLPDAVYPYVCEIHPSLMSGSVTIVSPTPPDAPVALTAIAEDGQIRLLWNAVCGASGYEVFRSTDVSLVPFPELLTTTADTTYADPYDLVGSRYFYEIRALRP